MAYGPYAGRLHRAGCQDSGMDEWLGRYVAALARGLDEDTPPVDLGPGGEDSVLDLARLVADGAHPKNIPLACFLAGCYVALRVSKGQDAAGALDEARRVARRLLPDPPQPGPARSGIEGE